MKLNRIQCWQTKHISQWRYHLDERVMTKMKFFGKIKKIGTKMKQFEWEEKKIEWNIKIILEDFHTNHNGQKRFRWNSPNVIRLKGWDSPLDSLLVGSFQSGSKQMRQWIYRQTDRQTDKGKNTQTHQIDPK